MNRELNSAVRNGSRKAAAGVRGAVRRMRIWQKAGLVLCLTSFLASLGTGAMCRRTADGLTDQGFASRWSAQRESAQISSFFAESALMSDDMVSSLYAGIMTDLQTASIALSQAQIENGANLVDTCYCGMGTAQVDHGGESVSVEAVGVGGDFFNFHPLDLMSGYYFSDDDLMQDRILLDDATAWRLFGSPYVVGMQVTVGGAPHVIAGVFKRPQERFYKQAGMGDYMVFLSYDSLCRYTEVGNGGGSTDSPEDDSDFDARAPLRAERAQASAAGEDAAAPLAKAEDPGSVVYDGARGALRTAKAAAAAPGGMVAAVPRTAAYAASYVPDADAREEGAAFIAFISAAPEGPLPQAEALLPEAGSRIHRSGSALSETLEGGETADDAGSDAGEDSAEEPEDGGDDGPADDDYTPGGASAGGSYGSDGTDGGEERPEVNRSRISCYEAVLPNPVSGYALRLMRSRISQAGFSGTQAVVVDNSARYDILRLASLVAQPGVRSMQTAAIRYPYWENVALAWEDVLIPLAVLTLVLRFAPLLFLLFLVLWYATHKSWTVGGGIRYLQDRLYDRQAARLYGKKEEPPLLEAGGEEKKALPDGGDDDPAEDGYAPGGAGADGSYGSDGTDQETGTEDPEEGEQPKIE